MGIGLLAGALGLISAAVFVRTPFFTRRRSAALAGAPVAAIVAITWFVLSEDDYVGGGVSRWTRYSGATHALYWVTIAVATVAVTLLVGAAALERPPLGRIGAFVSGLACACGVVTAIGFSVN